MLVPIVRIQIQSEIIYSKTIEVLYINYINNHNKNIQLYFK
jgi:hypothetical protein